MVTKFRTSSPIIYLQSNFTLTNHDSIDIYDACDANDSASISNLANFEYEV